MEDTHTCSACGETIDLVCHCGESPSGPSHYGEGSHAFVSYNTCLCEFIRRHRVTAADVEQMDREAERVDEKEGGS